MKVICYNSDGAGECFLVTNVLYLPSQRIVLVFFLTCRVFFDCHSKNRINASSLETRTINSWNVNGFEPEWALDSRRGTFLISAEQIRRFFHTGMQIWIHNENMLLWKSSMAQWLRMLIFRAWSERHSLRSIFSLSHEWALWFVASFPFSHMSQYKWWL